MDMIFIRDGNQFPFEMRPYKPSIVDTKENWNGVDVKPGREIIDSVA